MGKMKDFLNKTVLVFGLVTFVSGMVILLYAVPKKYTLIPVGGALSALSVYSFIYLVSQVLYRWTPISTTFVSKFLEVVLIRAFSPIKIAYI